MTDVELDPDEDAGGDLEPQAPPEGGDEDEPAGGGEADTPADLPPASDEETATAEARLAEAFRAFADVGFRPVAVPEGVELADFLTFPDCPVCEGSGKTPFPVQQDPHAARCDDCRGHGVVITGSFVPGHEQRDCPTCLGQGYTTDTTPAPFVIPPPRAERQAVTIPRPDGSPPWPGAEWDSGAGIWRDGAELAGRVGA